MKKITEEQIKDFVKRNGVFEKEHRKGSSFYCWSDHTFTEKDIELLKEREMDASDFLNIRVLLSGMWDDNWGTDWTDIDYYRVETVQKLIPEQVIPAHYVTESVETGFKPVWQ